MKKSIVAIALLAATGGCSQPPEIEGCANFIKSDLNSPSTFKIVKVTSSDRPINWYQYKQEAGFNETKSSKNEFFKLMKEQSAKLGVRDFFIEFDSDNAFGTPIRGVAQCKFPLFDGKIGSKVDIDAKVSHAIAEKSLNALIGMKWGLEAKPENSKCCLR